MKSRFWVGGKMPLNDLELGRFVGLLEGEGSIHIAKVKSRPSNPVDYCKLTIEISNNKKALLQHINDTMGFGYIYEWKETNKRKNNSFRWIVNGDHCKELLEIVLPFLIIKRRQAEVALEFIKLRDAPKRGVQRTPEIRARMLELHSEMRELNKRGKQEAKVR